MPDLNNEELKLKMQSALLKKSKVNVPSKSEKIKGSKTLSQGTTSINKSKIHRRKSGLA